jgi:putative hydrolase of the HAD superfamily
MARIKAISLDAGGTLLFPNPSVGAIYSEIALKHGLQAEPAAIESSFKKAWQEAQEIPRLGIDNDTEKKWWRIVVGRTLEQFGQPGDMDGLFEELWVAFADPVRWRLMEGSVECLEALRERGYRLILLSNWDERLRPLMERMKLADYFEHLIISCEVGAEKPDSKIFHVAREKLDLPPEEILHVGDSHHHDIVGAMSVGWNAIRLSHSSSEPSGPDVIHAIRELPERLA